MPAKWQRIAIEIPDYLTPAEREQLGDDIIEAIKRRTEKGVDRNGKKFPAYSKAYTESMDFKIAGKSKNSVDLQLSGDMLASINLLSHRKGKLLIGFENGSDENARADGNITGSYGGSPNPKRARDFLGLPDSELDKILSHYERSEDEV